jgi:hypothetical protein
VPWGSQQLPPDHRADGAASSDLHASLLDDLKAPAALEQVARRTSFDACQHMALIAKHRDHHRIAFWQMHTCFPNQLDAADAGQADVDQQHIGARCKQQAQALGQVFSVMYGLREG